MVPTGAVADFGGFGVGQAEDLGGDERFAPLRGDAVEQRLGAVTAAVVAATLVAAGPAAAHVTVNPREAQQGGFTKLAFRVPNEKDNASTVKLEVVVRADRVPVGQAGTGLDRRGGKVETGRAGQDRRR
jgi:hypothetical protein